MILLGGAGTTMLDAWVTPDRWRIAVPPLGVVRRGGSKAPDDLPVAFLRYAFFGSLGGRLFAASMPHDGSMFLLRDGDALVEVRERRCDRGTLTIIRRRTGARTERAEECGTIAFPRPGDWVAYRDERSGIRVDLAIETLGVSRPDARAFEDPDSPEGAL
ncbi:MAG: hypothetical protein M3O50_11345 [Myxococcota bacterium]|nr:hypothetical protein [Myxococcota bacterium]